MTQLCEAVFELLKDANERGETEKFRADFPPSNVIFDKNLRKKLRDIDQICPLGGENVLFIASNDDDKTLYLLEGDRVSEVAKDVIAVGKSGGAGRLLFRLRTGPPFPRAAASKSAPGACSPCRAGWSRA